MAYTWAKIYIEILDDHKMGRLPDGLWRRVIELILLAKKLDKEGWLPGMIEMSWVLRIPAEQLEADLTELSKSGIVELKDGNWFLTNFQKRQSAEPVVERVRNFRKRQDSQDGNESETQSYQTKTRLKTRQDEEVGASAPPSAPAKRKPRQSNKDERTNTPAIQACYRTVGKYPPMGLYDKLIGALGNVPDIQRLTECRTAWLERGYNCQAWTWATEWYTDGIPSRNGQKARGNDGLTVAEQAIALSAKHDAERGSGSGKF